MLIAVFQKVVMVTTFCIHIFPVGCELWLFRDFLFLAAYEVVSHLVVITHESRLVLFFVFEFCVKFRVFLLSLPFILASDRIKMWLASITNWLQLIHHTFFLIPSTLVWFGDIISGQDPISIRLNDFPTINFQWEAAQWFSEFCCCPDSQSKKVLDHGPAVPLWIY